MKYFNIYILLLSSAMLMIESCKKMDHFQINPNEPTMADPSLELTNIEQNMFSVVNRNAALASRQLVYTQSASDDQYYGWKRSGMSYNSISQVVKMQQEARRTNKPNYIYIGKFFTSHYIIEMTRALGDIPYSQMMGLLKSDNEENPEYDSQKDIYLGVLDELKIASDSLSESGVELGGDVIYNGDIGKWKKLINSYRLRILMSLSKKEADPDLNIKQRFDDIVSNPQKYPLMTSNDDNGQLEFHDITGNRYTYYNDNSMKTDFYLDSSFVQILQDLHDPRLFVYGEPTINAVDDGLPANDWNAYGGLWGSGDLGYNNSKVSHGEASALNKRYAYEPVNEPSVLMSYAELQFILAEAAQRGWINDTPDSYYREGIKASLEFSNFEQTYSQNDIQDYLNQQILDLTPGSEIEQIITQKYIGLFMNSGWEQFYENRRTGFPKFELTGSGVINQYNGVNTIPVRWMYPIDEYDNNTKNIEDAVSRQFPEGDNVNSVMWLIK